MDSRNDFRQASRLRKSTYVIRSENDVRQRQEKAIADVVTLLSTSNSEATVLLPQFKWCIDMLSDDWFSDEARVRKAVGLSEGVARGSPNELTCGICFEGGQASENMKAAACSSHYYCHTCWKGYLQTAIDDGAGCLTLRCPDPRCRAAIGEDMVMSLVSDGDRGKYSRHLLRSYVDGTRKVKWCPAPGCEYAVECSAGGNTSHEVLCKCGHTFCWNCLEEAHRPVDCDTAQKWLLKNSVESANTSWILANSKPCPKCRRPIEKSGGCMHMTCTPPCNFQFCWRCQGPWSEHGEQTGGNFTCNRYAIANEERAFNETERQPEIAKNSLERYSTYYEGWARSGSMGAKALSDLQQIQVEKLSAKYCQPPSQLNFIPKARLQIAKCCRILKWTHAYAYYLPEHEISKRQLLEYLQGEAKFLLASLERCAEDDFLEFNLLRTKLARLTSVTKTYFENLVGALENGLSDVQSMEDPRGSEGRWSFKNTTAETEFWSCERCTFANPRAHTVCMICNNPRS